MQPPSSRAIFSKILYAFVFCLFIPGLLVQSARTLEPFITLNTPDCPGLGWGLLTAGLTLMISAMVALKIKGGGLPMNGFPPPKFVTSGAYRITPHPIYTGFILSCAGISIAASSSAGLYLITPLTALGCLAIIRGYEKHDLEKRFGACTPTNFFSLPPDNQGKASWFDRIRICTLMYGLWAIVYAWGPQTGISLNAPSCRLFGEETIPVMEIAGWPYISIYPVAVLFSLSLWSNRSLRIFAETAALPVALGFLLYLCIPLSGEPLPFTPSTWGGFLLQLDRELDLSNSIAFPSYHILWGLIFLWTAVKMGMSRTVISTLLIWFLLMATSCVLTGMHGWIDLAGAGVIFLISERRNAIYSTLLSFTQKLVNSWNEYRIGPLRLINHSLYAFLAAGGGFYLILCLTGGNDLFPILLVMSCSLIGSAVWAQLLEGSSLLLRPFGYYGSILGGILGVALVFLLNSHHPDSSPWIIFAAFATAAPFIQAIGRLRCMVQGCCHGKPVEAEKESKGIRHTNPSSRVCALTSHTNTPLYPTPLYSLIMNTLTGILLLRLWLSHVPAGLLIGLYFILAGLSRFVEEAYRGEPQTRRWHGLSEYQWFSFILLILGFTTWYIPSSMIAVPPINWTPGWWWISLLVGGLYAFCMGMDFPSSNKRFSRLTG